MMHGDSRVMGGGVFGDNQFYQHPVCQLPLSWDPAKNLLWVNGQASALGLFRFAFASGSRCGLRRGITSRVPPPCQIRSRLQLRRHGVLGHRHEHLGVPPAEWGPAAACASPDNREQQAAQGEVDEQPLRPEQPHDRGASSGLSLAPRL